MDNYKELLSIIAIALTFIAFIPYITSILSGQTKPHVFSWVIWGITTFIVFLAQLADKGGAGAWPIGISGLITMGIAALAYSKKADIRITKSDWLFFILALSAIPFWYMTANPFWAVIVLTSADLPGFVHTFRKAYIKPFEEQMAMYFIISLRNLVAIAALENYSPTTVLFPAAMTLASIVLITVIIARRKTRAVTL